MNAPVNPRLVECWLPIAGWEGAYSVSSFGRVRSEARVVARGSLSHPVRERILAYGLHSGGYLNVTFSKGGKTSTQLVHRLVLEQFDGPCPNGMECRHLDGNGRNPRLKNLLWGTPIDNAADRELHGTQPRGERIGNSKLTEAKVAAIRADSRFQWQIAADFGISQTAVSKIKLRKMWKVVGGHTGEASHE